MPLIKYRPKPSRYGKKESEEHAEQYRQELITFGLDDESARAVQIAARADRLDFEACHSARCTYLLLTLVIRSSSRPW
jgi:hypothetical protein